jgi:hypothetical protein
VVLNLIPHPDPHPDKDPDKDRLTDLKRLRLGLPRRRTTLSLNFESRYYPLALPLILRFNQAIVRKLWMGCDPFTFIEGNQASVESCGLGLKVYWPSEGLL